MSEWPVVRFEDLAAREKSAISKPYGSAFTAKDYVDVGVPMVRGVNLGTGRFADDNFVYISDSKANQIPGANLQGGDLVFTHRGVIGQVAMVPRSPRFPRYVLSTSQVKARLDSNLALPEFYLYWFLSPAGQRALLSRISTVGVPGLAQPVATIKATRVPHPPMKVQRSITDVLGSLDEKIAVNDRVASMADALTVSLFQIWVQREELSTTSLREVATVVLGGTPDRSVPEYWTSGTVNWVNSGSANLLRIMKPSARITELALQKSAAKMMPQGATVLAITGATLGQVSRLEIASSGNQSLVGAWVDNPALNDWLYFWVRQNIGDLTRHATGGAQQHINKGVVESMTVALPSSDVLGSWHEAVRPLMDTIAETLRENATLAELRNTLLPELMSGRLRIKDAEKVVEEAV
ncbi:restriction endonuclease subunit S [Plantactinospora sp. KLBMP9567]|uniref:restriction endonuclease subunit S n=1 Tax=Plantactinospora sp. KLBMP9567 TaxID=3085900 RepID=UPI002980F104|nr:restriction endonuclease subunit S [Plantactinospora sp. KLBMP9567]MDW5330652.1 restriction endonuclease subunit S [Plantactinospora sp. KLBMP9567]